MWSYTSLRAAALRRKVRCCDDEEAANRDFLRDISEDHSEGVAVITRMKTTTIVRHEGNVICARCVVATKPWTRMRGLLGRSSLAREEGMLFPHTGSVHMLFMRFAIDAVFLDRDLVVLDVVRDLRPWRMASRRGAKYVLELAEGAAAGLGPGDRLTLATIDA